MEPKILIYSPPGHGKTHFIGSCVESAPGKKKGEKVLTGDPRLTPLLILDFEGGVMPIQSKSKEIVLGDLTDKFIASPINYIRIKTWDDFTTIYNYIADHPGLFKAIAVDSLSEINYLNLQTAVEQEVTMGGKHDPDIPEQRDYLRSATQMRRLVRAFRDLPMTVIFTSHAKEERDPRTAILQLRPNLVGKLPNELPGMMDIMGYLAIEREPAAEGKPGETKRVLICQPSPELMAKDRSEGGKLGYEIYNPTLPKLFDLLES